MNRPTVIVSAQARQQQPCGNRSRAGTFVSARICSPLLGAEHSVSTPAEAGRSCQQKSCNPAGRQSTRALAANRFIVGSHEIGDNRRHLAMVSGCYFKHAEPIHGAVDGPLNAMKAPSCELEVLLLYPDSGSPGCAALCVDGYWRLAVACSCFVTAEALQRCLTWARPLLAEVPAGQKPPNSWCFESTGTWAQSQSSSEPWIRNLTDSQGQRMS